MSAATVTIDGKRFVILPETEYERLRGSPVGDEPKLPPLPKQRSDGNYPAIEYARAVTARHHSRPPSPGIVTIGTRSPIRCSS